MSTEPRNRPELEGRLHPLALLTIARRFIGASLIPLVALLVSLGTKVLVPLLVAALLLGVPLAVVSWLRFRYLVVGGRLELHSGVFSRNVRTVPLDRIRGIDVSAPFLHRLLGLVKVEVEAAAGGGSKAELSLAAVSRAQADALRAVLLGTGAAVEKGPTILHRAGAGILALGGVTSLRYLVAPLAIVGVAFNLLDDLPGGLLERAEDAASDLLPTDPLGVTAFAAGAILFVLFVGAAGSLLVDWNFTLTDDGERLTAARGLLTRRVVTIDRERLRGADVHDTPLRRMLRLVSVTAVVAGLHGRTGGTTLAPVLGASATDRLLRVVDPAAPALEAPLLQHPRAARSRRLQRAVALPLLAVLAAAAFQVPWAVGGAVLLVALAVVLGLDRYRQLGHGFDGRRLVLRGGSLLRRWSELDPAGVVAYEVRSSPGQRRAGLCTLVVHLGQGAGSRRALDAGDEQAAVLLAGLHPRLLEPLLEASE